MDAQEIKTAVAHQDAARAAAEAPFVNRVRPGPGARPGRAARGQPTRPDLGGRPGRPVERLALAAQPPGQRPRRDRADPRPDRRGARGPVRPGQVPGRHHAVLHEPDRPERSRTTRSACRSSRPRSEHGAFTGMMEDSLAEDRHSPGPGPRPSLPGPRPDARHDPVRELLPVLHAAAGSSATRPRTSTAATTRPSSSTCAGRRRSATS